MSRLGDRLAWSAAPLLGGYLGVVTLGGLDALVTHICPEIETALSPVVAFAPVDAISRDATRVCYALHIEKRHAAVPLKYSFFVEARLSDRIPVAAYLVDADRHRLKNADLATHPVGERWTRHYCFELPQTVADLDVRVTGAALHRRHPLWDTPTPIPGFFVAAPAG